MDDRERYATILGLREPRVVEGVEVSVTHGSRAHASSGSRGRLAGDRLRTCSSKS